MQTIVIDKKIIINIVKVIMALLAVVCIIVESQFNYPKIRELLEDPFALFLSILLPIFTSFAVEASAILRKQGVKAAAFALMFAALVSMLFSVTMIVRGQYDKQIQKENIAIEERSENKSDTKTYDLKQAQLTEKKSSIERTEKEIERLDKILEKNPNDTNTYWTRYYEIQDLKKLESERDAISTAIEKMLEEGTVEQESKEERSFDQWFADLYDWKPESVKMFLYMILPIFIVFIAPLGVYFALGLYEGNEPKESLFKRIFNLVQNKPIQKKEKRKYEKKKIDIKKSVETWVQYNWMSLKNGYNRIIPKETFLTFMKNKGIEFDSKTFDQVFKLSEEKGCTKNGIIVEQNDAESVRKMLTN